LKVEIRKENDLDHDEIRRVTEKAFRDKPYAGGDEQIIIDRLRSKGELHLSLVAHANQTIVGHIAFSRAKTSDNSQTWFALGPVSVLPDYQGNGIGTKLILQGLAQVENQGALGCILTGNPNLYRKFDFVLAPDNAPSVHEKSYFMIKRFGSTKPAGPMYFDSAFYGDDE